MELYDYLGNELGLDIHTDKTLTQSDAPADAKTVGDLFDDLDVSATEPRHEDIPQLYITGTLPTSKDDGKLKVQVEYISKTARFKEYATLKVQGNTSAGFPKKNFTITFFSDANCTVKSKHNFKGWGNQNKYVIKANWIDITHARNIVSARLWTDVVKTRSNYNSLPQELKESPNLGTIDGFSIKVYANGIYQGRYTLNMPKDKWMYNMDDSVETNMVLYSEDYGSGCYKTAAVVDGTDWTDEIHEDDPPQSVINKLNAFITFLNNSTDSEFVANLGNYADVLSIIDYYLFGYVDCGHDSFGKNQILMSYDNSVFIAGAYDLDCTWGLHWNGASLYSYDHDFTEYSGYVNGNVLYIRLRNLFPIQIKARYQELRNGPLSAANIIHRFEEFMDNLSNDLIAEDYAETTANGAFVNIPSKDLTSLQQIRNFVAARLNYVDSQILT